jgi:hypothetical protein
MTYGGNEEIVLKGPGARKSQKQEKTESYRAKECICTTFIRYSLPESDFPEAEWEYAAAADVDKENIIQRSKEISLVRSYTRSGKDSQRRSVS